MIIDRRLDWFLKHEQGKHEVYILWQPLCVGGRYSHHPTCFKAAGLDTAPLMDLLGLLTLIPSCIIAT